VGRDSITSKKPRGLGARSVNFEVVVTPEPEVLATEINRRQPFRLRQNWQACSAFP
jgi:hypothetical protein